MLMVLDIEDKVPASLAGIQAGENFVKVDCVVSDTPDIDEWC